LIPTRTGESAESQSDRRGYNDSISKLATKRGFPENGDVMPTMAEMRGTFLPCDCMSYKKLSYRRETALQGAL